VEAVGADDVLAIDADDPVAGPVAHARRVRCDVVQRHVLGIVHDLAFEPVARLVEVARQLGLAVDHHRVAARILVEVDAVEHAVMGDLEPVVDLALAVHPLAALRCAHQFGEAVLQNPGADTGKHVLAAVFLQNDGVDALQMQELGQHEPGRAATDDANLNLHLCRLPSASHRAVRNDGCGLLPEQPAQ
jgi:hypothetical protein